jgi:predicted SnoaL-like aldol condensation-catalyzing enzyme
VKYALSRRSIMTAAAAASLAVVGRAYAQSTPAASPQALALTGLSENEQKAVAVVKSFETGDPTAFEEYVSEETYIQHNLMAPDGRQFILETLPSLAEAGTTVDVRRVIEDGDLVALHIEYTLFGTPTIAFDVYRFEDGLIVEHWDNLQEAVTDTVSGRSMIDGPTEVTDLDRTEANKDLVRGFVEDVLMGKAPERITDYISAEGYAQHNPGIADNLEGLTTALEAMAEQGITMRYDTLHQVIGEGNFVLAMSEGELAGEPTAFYDLFRVEGGKIVEHWDVLQTIPPQEEWQNENGKF